MSPRTRFDAHRFSLSSFLPLLILLVLARTFAQDRQPAVAGQFYPDSPTELLSMLKELFAQAAPSKDLANVVALISPHAGYVFSGGVAASAYSQINRTKHYDNIFILGPSHYVGFEGAAIYSKGNFITPLGTVKVNTQLAEELIQQHAFFTSRSDAHLREHSVEVQVPFLQYRFGNNITIVPIVLGQCSPKTCSEIGEALRPYFNVKNLFVISTDFSHYPAYDDAKRVDQATADAIVSKSPENLIRVIQANERKGIPDLATSLCGWPCVLTLMYLAHENPEVVATLIQYKNSGDTPYGQKDGVVGYNAIAFSLRESKEKRDPRKFDLNDREKKELLRIARRTIEQYVKDRTLVGLDTTKFSNTMKMNCGAFVTLRKHEELRGCIGRFDASEPLHKVVQQMAIAAATEDYRFPPVEPQETNQLDIEISVLTPMRRIGSIDEIELGKHGIYIRKGTRGGTFLPQVATETGWSKEEFLRHCAQDKAGIGWDGWKDAEIYVYEAKVFSEKDFKNQ
jgi:AmmeMemoRadiSam system protein B/AmmeMemoRadiSam system protein A